MGSNTTRAAFLTASAIGVTLAATACATGATGPGAPADMATIEAILRKPARHKQVIAAPKIDGGAALRYAGNTLNAFQFAFAEGAGSLHVACVFYGTALLFAADDWLWDKYHLFDVLDRTGDPLPTMVHSPQNPFYRARSSAPPSDPAKGGQEDFSVEALTRRGASWLVCNNALNGLTRELATASNLDPAGVYNDFRTHFVAGTTVVPSGTAAIVLAQESGFTFLPA